MASMKMIIGKKREMEYAKLCKVEKLVTPYLEAMVSLARIRPRMGLPSLIM